MMLSEVYDDICILKSDFWQPLPYVVLLAFAAIDWTNFHFSVHETKGKDMINFMPPKSESWFHKRRLARNAAANKGDEPAELLPAQDVEGTPLKT